ncbi:MAG: DUF364 domain-containing protein [Spirochaetales bacterium]|nr:DUF364 domain-containing protein [Spirochaetales bacterium]
MKIHEKLYAHALPLAENRRIQTATVGLKYTAVSLDDGSLGVSYTWNQGHCCGPMEEAFRDYEDEKAQVLLEKIREDGPVGRSLAVALLNALNSSRALAMPLDKDNSILFDALKLKEGSFLAMVGFFKPVVKLLRDIKVELYIIDHSHNMGSADELYGIVKEKAEALIVTSTTIVNGSFDEIMEHCPAGLPIAMLGPTTPMIPEVFTDYGISFLAGTAPDKIDLTMRLLRQGAGTPDFQKHARKVYCFV